MTAVKMSTVQAMTARAMREHGLSEEQVLDAVEDWIHRDILPEHDRVRDLALRMRPRK